MTALRNPHAAVIGVLVLVLALAMYAFLRSPLYEWQHRVLSVRTPTPETVDAIIVLGYAVDHDAALVTPPLASRLETAYQLTCHQRLSSTVLMTGGCSWSKRDELPSEAQVMADWLVKRWRGDKLPQTSDCYDHLSTTAATTGVATSSSGCHGTREPAILTENDSTSTYTNALYSLRILKTHYPHIRHLLLVTNQFHQYRTHRTFVAASQMKEFSECKYTVGMAWMERNLDWFDQRVTQWDFWREIAAIVYYKVRGYM